MGLATAESITCIHVGPETQVALGAVHTCMVSTGTRRAFERVRAARTAQSEFSHLQCMHFRAIMLQQGMPLLTEIAPCPPAPRHALQSITFRSCPILHTGDRQTPEVGRMKVTL